MQIHKYLVRVTLLLRNFHPLIVTYLARALILASFAARVCAIMMLAIIIIQLTAYTQRDKEVGHKDRARKERRSRAAAQLAHHGQLQESPHRESSFLIKNATGAQQQQPLSGQCRNRLLSKAHDVHAEVS